ncbi:MAG: SURF1 family protein [Longimicrobiales bacterium]
MSAEQHRRAARPMSTRSRVIGTLLVLIIAAVCIRLGFWQLSRLEEKRTVNAALAERSAQPSVRLTSALRDTVGLIFRSAVASGQYDNERTIIFPGRSHRGQPGVLVLTPLRLAGGSAVLVQRGWAPSADGVSVDLEPMRIDSAVTVTGLVLTFPGAENSRGARAETTEANDSFRRNWFRVDSGELPAAFPNPLLPLRLQQLPDTSPRDASTANTSYPVAQEAPALDEGPHMGYAVQWFSFALIFLIGWVALLWSRRERPGESTAQSD